MTEWALTVNSTSEKKWTNTSQQHTEGELKPVHTTGVSARRWFYNTKQTTYPKLKGESMKRFSRRTKPSDKTTHICGESRSSLASLFECKLIYRVFSLFYNKMMWVTRTKLTWLKSKERDKDTAGRKKHTAQFKSDSWGFYLTDRVLWTCGCWQTATIKMCHQLKTSHERRRKRRCLSQNAHADAWNDVSALLSPTGQHSTRSLCCHSSFDSLRETWPSAATHFASTRDVTFFSFACICQKTRTDAGNRAKPPWGEDVFFFFFFPGASQ